MSVFTTADRDAVKAALITAATDGIASVAISGQEVRSYLLQDLQSILNIIMQDLASSNPLGGMRMVKTIPPAGGG